MITAIMTVLGWLGRRSMDVLKWFIPRIGRLIANSWLLAGTTVFALSVWGLSHWDGLCDGVASYLDLLAQAVGSVQITTGVSWIDGFMGFFALDAFFSYLVGFVGFFLPLVGSVVFGVLVSMLAYAFKLIVYKMTAQSTRDLSRT